MLAAKPMLTAATMAAASLPAIKDQAAAGSAFFFNIRTPAALLAAGALKDAFVLADSHRETGKWKALCNAYTLLMILSFGAELCSVFMATVAGNRLLAGSFNPMDASVIGMLIREFEWEYVSVRCQFVTGLLAYSLAQGLRVAKELRRDIYLARSAVCFMAFCTFQMLGFFNSHLVFFGGYPHMVGRYMQLACAKALSGRILPACALASLTGAGFFAVCSVADLDGDGKLSKDEVKHFSSNVISALRFLGRPWDKRRGAA